MSDSSRGATWTWIIGSLALSILLSGLLAVVHERLRPVTGLTRVVFQETGLAGEVIDRSRATTVDLELLEENPSLPRRLFSIRWSGIWHVPTEGVYQMYLGADDRARLTIDGRVVHERSLDLGMGTTQAPVSLAAGSHSIEVEYEQERGSSHLNLQWALAGRSPTVLDPYSLFPAEPAIATQRLLGLARVLRPTARLGWILFLGVAIWRVGLRLNRVVQTQPGSWQDVRLRVTEATWPLLKQVRRRAPALALVAVAALTIRTAFSRLPGWNPASLWYDDLVWGAIVRLNSLGEALAIPVHAEPGFLMVLWASRRLFEDPEWSLQLVPFVCGIAAIPVMGLLVKRLTGDDGLGALAAAMTSLNPLLAHYTVFVKQYSMGFLITGCLLLGAVWLFQDREIKFRKFLGVASFGSAMLFFSVPSTFASFPIVNLGALRSLRAWSRDRRRTILVLLTAVGYNLVLLLAYFLIRGRSNPLVRRAFRRGFMDVRSFEDSWEFIATSGRRLIETSLPTWVDTPLWNPQTVTWTWPIVAVGLGWVLMRSRTRLIGLVVLSFYAAFFVASALRVYPLGNGRTDVFAFPVAIALFTVGVHALTAWMAKPAVIRAVVGLSTIAFAILQPLHVEYWGVDDARLIRMVEVLPAPGDGLILSPAGGYLAVHYGRWPFRVSATDKRTNATDAEIVRDRTLHLKPWADPLVQLDGFLEDRPSRIWFVDFRSDGQGQNVLDRLGERGYSFTEVDRSARGRLLMCVDLSLPP